MQNKSRQTIRTKFKLIAIFSSVLILILAMLIYFQFGKWNSAMAADKNCYRSTSSGDWNNPSVWKMFNGEKWETASSAPDVKCGFIEVMPGHNVTVTRDLLVDQLVVDSGATLTLQSGQLSVAGKPGTGFLVKGTLDIISKIFFNPDASMDVHGTCILRNSGSIFASKGSVLNLTGKLRREGGAIPDSPDFIHITGKGIVENAIVTGQVNVQAAANSQPESPVKENIVSQVTEAKSGNTNRSVDPIGFEASLKSAAVIVSWKTLPDTMIRTLAVERSPDGINFAQLAQVDAKKPGIKFPDYRVRDEQPLMGKSYYRIRQTDKAGQESHSSPICINFTGLSLHGKFINIDDVVVNPSNGAIYATFSSRNIKELDICMINPSGKVINKAVVKVNDGYNSYVYYPASSLLSGFYLMKLSCDEGATTQKVFVP